MKDTSSPVNVGPPLTIRMAAAAVLQKAAINEHVFQKEPSDGRAAVMG